MLQWGAMPECKGGTKLHSREQWLANKLQKLQVLNSTHTHTRLTALFLGLPMWAGTRKVKPIWLLLNQETVSGSDISWAVCTLLQTDNHASTPPATTQFFTGRMPFLPPNQQHHSTECNALKALKFNATVKLHTKSVSMIWYWQCCCCCKQ